MEKEERSAQAEVYEVVTHGFMSSELKESHRTGPDFSRTRRSHI